jgi:hypothetical protein
MLALRVLVRAAQWTRRLALHGGVDTCAGRWKLMQAHQYRDEPTSQLIRCSASHLPGGVSICEATFGKRDGPTERSTRRGFP